MEGREEQPTKISGVYHSTAITKNAHTEGRTTMSVDEMRDRIREQGLRGEITQVDLKAMEVYLNKVEYRSEYNARPEVKARRKEYNRKRRETEKMGRQLLNSLMTEGEGNEE